MHILDLYNLWSIYGYIRVYTSPLHPHQEPLLNIYQYVCQCLTELRALAEMEDEFLNSWTRPGNCQLQVGVLPQTFALPFSSSLSHLLSGSASSGLDISPVTLNPLTVLREPHWSHLLIIPWIDPRTGEAWFPMLEPHILTPRRCPWQTPIRMTPVCFSAGKTGPLGKNDHWQAPERYFWVSKLWLHKLSLSCLLLQAQMPRACWCHWSQLLCLGQVTLDLRDVSFQWWESLIKLLAVLQATSVGLIQYCMI